jgi:IS30 family transposase
MAVQTHASYKQRCYVQALHSVAGWSTRRIATALPLKKSTVARICQAPTTPKKHRYYSSFNTPARKKLIDFITSSATTQQMPLKEVKAQMSLQCSVRTMQKALAEEGYGRRIARKKPW